MFHLRTSTMFGENISTHKTFRTANLLNMQKVNVHFFQTSPTVLRMVSLQATYYCCSCYILNKLYHKIIIRPFFFRFCCNDILKCYLLLSVRCRSRLTVDVNIVATTKKINVMSIKLM